MAAPTALETSPRRRLQGGLMMSMLCSILEKGPCATSLPALTQVRHGSYYMLMAKYCIGMTSYCVGLAMCYIDTALAYGLLLHQGTGCMVGFVNVMRSVCCFVCLCKPINPVCHSNAAHSHQVPFPSPSPSPPSTLDHAHTTPADHSTMSIQNACSHACIYSFIHQ